MLQKGPGQVLESQQHACVRSDGDDESKAICMLLQAATDLVESGLITGPNPMEAMQM